MKRIAILAWITCLALWGELLVNKADALDIVRGNVMSALTIPASSDNPCANIDGGLLYVDCSNERVGIGTTSPVANKKLTVTNTGNNSVIAIEDSDSTLGSEVAYLEFRGSNGRQGYIGSASSADSDMWIINERNAAIQFHTNNTEVARLTAAGHLTVHSGVTVTSMTINRGSGSPSLLDFVSTTSGDRVAISTINFYGSDQSGNPLTKFAHITVYSDEGTDTIEEGAMRIGGMRAASVQDWATISGIGIMQNSPAAQTISAGNTVTANACGGMKLITSAGVVTTDTTNTFTAPLAAGIQANKSCIMFVCNSGSNNITLDNNANFKSAAAGDITLGADDCVLVGSTGSVWYQLSAVQAN